MLKVVLSVGGGGEGSKPFAGVARDPAKRDQFARSSLELVQRFGIDGIDSKSKNYALNVSDAHATASRLGAS